MVEMGRRFRKESSYCDFLADNPERMAKLARELLSKDGLLLSENDGGITGMFGYVVYDHFISGEKTAGEVFWWVDPENRGEGIDLLREAERRARSVGAKHMQMIAPTRRVEGLYRHLKYTYVETTYQKAL